MGQLEKLRDEAAGCRACDLWRTATQTVFGEGGERAELMMVGEQPGDREDIEGHPFVGPAGRILDQALEQVGIDRDLVYLTNVVAGSSESRASAAASSSLRLPSA